MISTGAFLSEMDASNKQSTVAEKFAAVWEKKNAKAARAGGVSLMALSLAACGSSSTTTSTTTTTDTTTSTATAAAKTMTLTTGVNTGTAFTGDTGDDTFIADNTGTAETTSAADTLTGGAGTDTLNVYSDGAVAAMPTLVGVEVVNVYDEDSAFTLSAVDQSSVTTLNFIRGDGAVFTTGANVDTVGLTNMTVASVAGGTDDLVVAFGATTTTATLNLDRLTHADGAADENVDVNGAKLATLNVNAIGTKSTIDVLDVAGASTINLDAAVNFTATGLTTSSTVATLNISGAGAVSLGTLDNGIDTVVATSNTGGVTMTAPADNSAASITLSAGNDVFTTNDDGFTAAQTFAVDGGDGTDVLVVAAAADINTADEQGRYTNFETVRLSDTYDADQIAGITAIQLAGASSKSYTDLTATQAANVQIRGDETSPTFTLKVATGTSDTLSLTMGTGLTTSAATDIVTGMTVTGFETINIAENGGATATAGADRTAIIAGLTGATVNDINLTGRAVTITDVATTVAVDIDGSQLTGNGNTGTSVQGLTVGGSAVAGSVITGSAFNDSMTIGAEGSTYKGGAGADAFSATVTLIAADGTTDLVIDGGAGTDTLTLTNTTGNTLTDSHFTNISNVEKQTLTNTGAGDTSITTGAAFNAAFADGVTITSGDIAAARDITVNGGLSTVDMTISIAATSQTGASTETNSIVTGSGDDTVTYTDTGFVGVSGAAGGTMTIDTNAGDDTISLTVGTIVSTNTAIISITGGSGQDSITKVGTNANDAQGVATFVFAAGDSNTVNYDTITGFDLSTASTFSDGLDFEGTGAVASFTSHDDFGTIKSHSVSTGIVTFDDAAGFSSALTISETNLADVVGYLAANMTANHVAAFAYDSTGNGAADGTMVFHQGSASTVADDLVFLAGVTADSVISVNASAGADDLFIA